MLPRAAHLCGTTPRSCACPSSWGGGGPCATRTQFFRLFCWPWGIRGGSRGAEPLGGKPWLCGGHGGASAAPGPCARHEFALPWSAAWSRRRATHVRGYVAGLAAPDLRQALADPTVGRGVAVAVQREGRAPHLFQDVDHVERDGRPDAVTLGHLLDECELSRFAIDQYEPASIARWGRDGAPLGIRTRSLLRAAWPRWPRRACARVWAAPRHRPPAGRRSVTILPLWEPCCERRWAGRHSAGQRTQEEAEGH